jgi:DnaJ-class molecular chaperone
LRNQGLKDRQGRVGDMMVKLNAQIPNTISQDLVEAIQKYRE